MHHLLNEYRPHQARESLIEMMEDQLERSKAETAGIKKIKEEVDGVLEGLEKTGLDKYESLITGLNGMDLDKKGDRPQGVDIWAELQREFEPLE